jgi:hypothetical protein
MDIPAQAQHIIYQKMKKIDCEICGCEMNKISQSTVENRRKKKFRKRRFKCTNKLCNHQVTIYADGSRDLEHEPRLAADEAQEFNDDINQN